jgi:hypothetical protein
MYDMEVTQPPRHHKANIRASCVPQSEMNSNLYFSDEEMKNNLVQMRHSVQILPMKMGGPISETQLKRSQSTKHERAYLIKNSEDPEIESQQHSP